MSLLQRIVGWRYLLSFCKVRTSLCNAKKDKKGIFEATFLWISSNLTTSYRLDYLPKSMASEASTSNTSKVQMYWRDEESHRLRSFRAISCPAPNTSTLKAPLSPPCILGTDTQQPHPRTVPFNLTCSHIFFHVFLDIFICISENEMPISQSQSTLHW